MARDHRRVVGLAVLICIAGILTMGYTSGVSFLVGSIMAMAIGFRSGAMRGLTAAIYGLAIGCGVFAFMLWFAIETGVLTPV